MTVIELKVVFSRVYVHHGVVGAISVEIQAVDMLGVEVAKIVDGDEPANFGIVVSRFEEIQTRLGIVVVPAVAERIKLRKFGVNAVKHFYGMVAPCVVDIFYHDCAGAVKIANNAIHVFYVLFSPEHKTALKQKVKSSN